MSTVQLCGVKQILWCILRLQNSQSFTVCWHFDHLPDVFVVILICKYMNVLSLQIGWTNLSFACVKCLWILRAKEAEITIPAWFDVCVSRYSSELLVGVVCWQRNVCKQTCMFASR